MKLFRNLKLSMKLSLGFGIMVVIAGALGYMGYSSLCKVEHTVVIGDEANRFIKIVNDARQAEKNFMLRGDEKYAKEMLEQKEPFDVLVEEITAQMKVAADKQLVAEMHAEAGAYFDQAKHYVDLNKKIVELTDSSGPIVQSARNVQKLADELASDQEKKLAVVMNVQANIAEGSRAHLNWAGAVKDFLADKKATLSVETDGNKCAFGQWLNSSEFAEQAAFCGQEFGDLIAGAKQKHLELHKSAIDIAAARKGANDTSMAVYQQKTAPILGFILGEFAKAEEILKTKVSERLANASDAKRINQLICETRRQEKNYFMRGGDEYVKKTNGQADGIIALAEDLKSRFRQQVNKDQVQQAIEACGEYKKAFADVVQYEGRQKVCETKMVAAARKLTEEASSLRVAKKEEMEAVAARANFIMITLAIAGVVIGVVLAFVITRMIVGPVRKCMESVTALSNQDFSVKADVDSKDEVGQMAVAINTSIDNTKKAFDDIKEAAEREQKAMEQRAEADRKAKEETDRALQNARVAVDNLNNLPTPVMTIDKEYNVTFMNPAGADILGSTPEQLVGKKCYSLFKTTHCQTDECRCAQAMQKDQICTGESVADPSGLNMPILYTGSPIKDGNGQVIGALEFVVDQTEIKKAQRVADNVAAYQEKEVEKLSSTLSRVADGDLTADYAVADPDDDTQMVAQAFDGIAKALNATVKSLSGVISQVTESAAQFNEGSRVIAESAQSMASGAQTQSSSVEEISASIEELTASISGVNDNATEADTIGKRANQLAEQGNTAVQQSIEAMNLIRTSSSQIGEITEVLAEIAGQTNLLALNAAIEAARAGEHGMGFAVVADEVRKLAERASQAATDISGLIKESGQQVAEGARVSEATGEALKEILQGVESTVSKISEIATATVEQSSNAQQVSEAIQGIAEVTEQSAAGSEEMASSSEELGAQASGLRDLVGRFKTDNASVAQ